MFALGFFFLLNTAFQWDTLNYNSHLFTGNKWRMLERSGFEKVGTRKDLNDNLHSYNFNMLSDIGFWSILFLAIWTTVLTTSSYSTHSAGRSHSFPWLPRHPSHMLTTHKPLSSTLTSPLSLVCRTQLPVRSFHLDLLLHLKAKVPKITLIT